jgi:hypothetical protein
MKICLKYNFVIMQMQIKSIIFLLERYLKQKNWKKYLNIRFLRNLLFQERDINLCGLILDRPFVEVSSRRSVEQTPVKQIRITSTAYHESPPPPPPYQFYFLLWC